MLLTVNDLSIILKENRQALVHNVSFSLNEGASLIILGQSGSGKTLTCKTIMGVLDRKKFMPQGEVLFEGEELLSMPPKKKRDIYGGKIALIPQNPMTALDPSVRIGIQMAETLFLHTGLKGTSAQEKIIAVLDEAGLNRATDITKSYPYMLSGGMLQRVLIAMALMVEAKLIVADEPTTALDAEHRCVTVDALCRLRERGSAVLLVTHDFNVASRTGGDLLIMKEGQVVERGLVEEVLTAPKHPYTRELIDASQLSTASCERSSLAC